MKKLFILITFLFISTTVFANTVLMDFGWKGSVYTETMKLENSNFLQTFIHTEGPYISEDVFIGDSLVGFGGSYSLGIGWTDSLLLANRLLFGPATRTSLDKNFLAFLSGLAIGFDFEKIQVNFVERKTNMFLIGFGLDVQLKNGLKDYGLGTALTFTVYPIAFGNYNTGGNITTVKIERYGRVEIGLSIGLGYVLTGPNSN